MNRPRPWQHHPILAGTLLVLLVLVLGLGLCEARGWPFLRAPLERFLDTHLDRNVSIGRGFALHLLPQPTLRTDSFAIGAPRWAGAQAGPFFGADKVLLRVTWRAVWDLVHSRSSAPLHVETLAVDGFDATLWRRADGRADWDFTTTKDVRERDASGRVPVFDHLIVHNGRLRLDDAPTGLRLAAEASTEEGAAGGREAGLLVRGNGQFREGQFSFDAHSNGVLPLIAPEGASIAVPVTVKAHAPHGRLSFEGQATDIVHLNTLSGRFAVSGSSLAQVGKPFGLTLPTTASFDAHGTLGKQGAVWRADFAQFAVGQSRLAGEFVFDRRPTPALLSGVLRGRNLDLADLGPAFGAAAPGAGNPPPRPGKVLPDREFDIPSLKMMNASVKVDLQRVDLHTQFLEPLTPLRAALNLRDGVLSADPLLARTSGGEISGRLRLDGRDAAHPHWDGDLHAAGVQLEHWVKMRNTHVKNGSDRGELHAGYLSGRLGAHTRFTGTGRSVAAMLASLDGSIAAWVNDGKVSHLALEASELDIAHALGLLIKGDEAVQLQCAMAHFNGRRGELRSDIALVDTADTTVLLDGDVNFGDETLAFIARADPKGFTPISLRTPIHLDGTFAKPHLHLEGKPIGIKAGLAAALSTLHPVAALLGLMDPGEKAPVGCEQALHRLRQDHDQPAQRALTAQAPALRRH